MKSFASKCVQRTKKWLLVSELFVRKIFIYTVNGLLGTKLCYILNLKLVKLNLIEIYNQKRSFLISCFFFVLDIKFEVSLIPRWRIQFLSESCYFYHFYHRIVLKFNFVLLLVAGWVWKNIKFYNSSIFVLIKFFSKCRRCFSCLESTSLRCMSRSILLW